MVIIICFAFIMICIYGCADNNNGVEINEVAESNNEPVMVLNKIDDEDKNATDNKISDEYDEIAVSESEDEAELNCDNEVCDTSVEDEEIEDNDQEDVKDEINEEGGEDDLAKPDFYYEPLSDEIKQRITGLSYPTGDCQVKYEDLSYVHILYVDFNDEIKEGELICANNLAQDFVEIFTELYNAGYQLQEVSLVDKYGADDDASCEANNTSAFNYRVVAGSTKLSKHSYGRAIDVNPMINPYVTFKTGAPATKLACSQPYIDRSVDFPHKIDENDLCYTLFKAHGFTWGGDWNSVKDYQHFEK